MKACFFRWGGRVPPEIGGPASIVRAPLPACVILGWHTPSALIEAPEGAATLKRGCEETQNPPWATTCGFKSRPRHQFLSRQC
jgi:hypothetical protein